jgi:hypothetical protein
MKRVYRLQGLERLRARALKDRQHALARAVGARTAAEREAARLHREEQRAREALVREIGDPAALAVWGELADAHHRGRGRAEQRVIQAREAEARARDEVAGARQQLRVLERLRERITEEGRLEDMRAEERELNDRNAGRHVRRTSLEGI